MPTVSPGGPVDGGGATSPGSLVSIVGCGYSGLRLSLRYRALGAEVRGYATRAESLRDIAATGAAACALNLDGPPVRVDCAARTVYYAVPPPPDGDTDPRLERFLAQLDGRPLRVIYLSTTGVYGDHAGARVDEDTPPAPKTQRARRRVAAEGSLRAWADAREISWCILRVPGIYGPGRLPLERLRRGEPAITTAEASPSNRIHVDDLVTACIAAGSCARADCRIFNVTDGSEDSPTDYLQRVARLAHLPPPPLVSRRQAEASFPAAVWSFLGESRRVDNRRMREELGVAPAYANLDAGILASLAQSVGVRGGAG